MEEKTEELYTFKYLILNSTSHDDEVKNRAKQQLNNIHVDLKINLILELITEENDLLIFKTSCDMLKEIINENIPDQQLSEPTSIHLREELKKLYACKIEPIEATLIFNCYSLLNIYIIQLCGIWKAAKQYIYNICIKSDEDWGKLISMNASNNSSFMFENLNNQQISEVFKYLLNILSRNLPQNEMFLPVIFNEIHNRFSLLKFKKKTEQSNNLFLQLFKWMVVLKGYSHLSEIWINLLMLMRENIEMLIHSIIPITEILISQVYKSDLEYKIKNMLLECLATLSETVENFKSVAISIFDEIIYVFINQISHKYADVNWLHDDDEEFKLERSFCIVIFWMSTKQNLKIIYYKCENLIWSKNSDNQAAGLMMLQSMIKYNNVEINDFSPFVKIIIQLLNTSNICIVYHCMIVMIELSCLDLQNFVEKFHHDIFNSFFNISCLHLDSPYVHINFISCLNILIEYTPMEILKEYFSDLVEIFKKMLNEQKKGLEKPVSIILFSYSLIYSRKYMSRLDETSTYTNKIIRSIIKFGCSFSSKIYADLYIDWLTCIAKNASYIQDAIEVNRVCAVVNSIDFRTLKILEQHRNIPKKYLESIEKLLYYRFEQIIDSCIPVLLEIISNLCDLNDDKSGTFLPIVISNNNTVILEKGFIILQFIINEDINKVDVHIEQIFNLTARSYCNVNDKENLYILSNILWCIFLHDGQNTKNINHQRFKTIVTCVLSIIKNKDCIHIVWVSINFLKGLIHIVSCNIITNDILIEISTYFSIIFENIISISENIDNNINFNHYHELEYNFIYRESLVLLYELRCLNTDLFDIIKDRYTTYFNKYLNKIIKIVKFKNGLYSKSAIYFIHPLIKLSSIESVEIVTQFSETIKNAFTKQDLETLHSCLFIVKTMAEFDSQNYQDVINIFIKYFDNFQYSVNKNREANDILSDVVIVMATVIKFCPHYIWDIESTFNKWIDIIQYCDKDINSLVLEILDLKSRLASNPSVYNSKLFTVIDKIIELIHIDQVDDDVLRKASNFINEFKLKSQTFFDDWFNKKTEVEQIKIRRLSQHID